MNLLMIMLESGEISLNKHQFDLSKSMGCDYGYAPLQCLFIVFLKNINHSNAKAQFFHEIATPFKLNHCFYTSEKLMIIAESD